MVFLQQIQQIEKIPPVDTGWYLASSAFSLISEVTLKVPVCETVGSEVLGHLVGCGRPLEWGAGDS